jgi:zinc protease
MRRIWLVLTAAAVAAVTLQAATPKITFTDTKLKNGLRVVIAEDHHAPVFSVAISYNVGSRDERPGRTGFAHLFEHMMFKGSQNVGPGEHFTLIFNSGGNMNGTTNEDRTLYYDTLPANQLDLALFLEADRMRSLEITKDNLDNQRLAVQEERRMRVDNQPYGKTSERFGELAYGNAAYRHSVIGSMADLSAATVDDVAAFFKTYYAPNNAVMGIAGDVNPVQALAKVRQYFEAIPSQPAAPPMDMTEPAQTAEKRETIQDGLARLTRLDIGYHVPPSSHADKEALNVLGTILTGGRSSRMYESLVRQKQLTTGVGAGTNGRRGPQLFMLSATAMPGKSVADLEAGIYAEIERLKTDPIQTWELDKARNSAKRGVVSSLSSSLNVAVTLAENALAYNDPGLINTQIDRINNVTAADVQRVAKQYLVPTNRTVLITTPKSAAPTGAEKGGR